MFGDGHIKDKERELSRFERINLRTTEKGIQKHAIHDNIFIRSIKNEW